MTDEENPLIKALPPATDYLTYLTIVEYNLNADNLPILHKVLQDSDLTINIGWDLVHLLLPLLPASEQCLQDIARLGNPREVVLKVTEALRLLEFEDPEKDSDEELGVATPDNGQPTGDGGSAVPGGESSSSYAPQEASTTSAPLPLPVLQFQVLLSMLSILHPRIKTKYPSRFLSTSLQAVLACYMKATTHVHDLTSAVIKFVKTLSGTKRPHLPPRVSSSQALTTMSAQSAPDPEAQAEPPSDDENALLKRLLQSFITHVLEEYMLSLASKHDVPGLAWSSRLQEKLHPERTVPGKTTYAEMFANNEALQDRSSTIGQIVALAQDLGLQTGELYTTIVDPRTEATGLPSKEDEPPSKAEDVPLSKTGALFLLTARKVSEVLYGSSFATPAIPVFPTHATILSNFISTEAASGAGLIPEALIDTILSLGLLAIENNDIGEPEDDDEFTRYLQKASLLSANTPSPTLRYHAHYLTSTILRSHPSDLVRLSFIRDTLEHCPYENLKTCAAGWLKGETIEANSARPLSSPKENEEGDNLTSVFATPVALSTVSPFLFPDLTHELSTPSLAEAWTQFKLNLGFYLATLNFYYLLLSARQWHEVLDVPGLHEEGDVGGSYLFPLRKAVDRFRKGLGEREELREIEGEEGSKAGLADLMLLEDALERVEEGVKGLNKA